MNKKTFVALLVLISILIGTQVVEIVRANPASMMQLMDNVVISIQSPENKTYTTNTVPLNFTVETNNENPVSPTCVLNGQNLTSIFTNVVSSTVETGWTIGWGGDNESFEYMRYTVQGHTVLSNLADGTYNLTIQRPGGLSQGTACANVTFTIDTSHSSSKANGIAYSPIENGLQLSISLDPNQIIFPQYPQGYIVNVSLAITNVSNKTKNFVSQQSSNIFNFRVYNNTDGKELYSWIASAYPIYDVNESLAPGENYSGCYVWGEMGGYNVGEYPLPPGEYYLIGETGVNQPHEFQTDPIKITIFASATPTPEVIVGSPTSASPTQQPTTKPTPPIPSLTPTLIPTPKFILPTASPSPTPQPTPSPSNSGTLPIVGTPAIETVTVGIAFAIILATIAVGLAILVKKRRNKQ